MRVLHSGSLDVRSGGPAMSTYLTLLGLRKFRVEAEIIMYEMTAGGKLRGEDVPVHYAKHPWKNKLSFSPTFRQEVMRLGEYDVYHAQGIWQWPTYVMASVARRRGKPYVITPRGMLYPQDIAKNKLFKEISLAVRLRNDLNRAACVQCTCEEEMQHLRNLGITAPVALIANPITIKSYPYKKKDDIFRVGYLGRVSPRKKVERLIRAFAALGKEVENAELLIVGNVGDSYEQQLRDEAARLGVNNVRFAGFLDGEEKDKAIASMSILVNPSDFENLGNVILEGLVHRIPCIATTGSPWKELRTYRCGWWIEPTQEAVTNAIRDALRMPRELLAQMGYNGFKLVSKQYNVDAIAQKTKAMYEWITGQIEKPAFINVNV